MAANDDYAAEPVSARRVTAPMAGVVGLDAAATETVTLFLEILGWSVATASANQDLPNKLYRLVFIDEQIFIANRAGLEGRFGKWGSIVVVGATSRATFIGTENAKIFRTDLPLDVAQLEIIAATAGS